MWYTQKFLQAEKCIQGEFIFQILATFNLFKDLKETNQKTPRKSEKRVRKDLTVP